LQLPLGYPKKPSSYCTCQRSLKKEQLSSESLRLSMGVKWRWWSYPQPTPPSSCCVRVRHCSGRWCLADCALDAECGGAAGGWPSVPAWRPLLLGRS
jgi:hypothetical protein